MGLPLMAAITPIAFARLANAVHSEVVSFTPGGTSGTGTLIVKPGDGALFSVPFAFYDNILATVISDPTYGTFPETYGTYVCAGVSGDTLTFTALLDGVSNAWQFGDIVEMRVDAEHINNLYDLINNSQGLNPTPVTVASQMVQGSYAICDSSAGAFTLQMPIAPATGSPAGGLLVNGSNPVTFSLPEGIFFNVANGPTTVTLSEIGQSFVADYQGALGVWYIITPVISGGGGSGTVTAVGVASDNGFSGASSGDPADPILTLGTTVAGITKGVSGALVQATAGTDYVVPSGSITGSAGTITGSVPASQVTGLSPSATTDTTNASNITSGTLASARLPAISASSITTGTLVVAQGGTGQSSLTAHAVVLGEGTSGVGFAPIGSQGAGTPGAVLIDQGLNTDPAFKSIQGDVNISDAGISECFSTQGVVFAPSATIDTTDASNITTGTLASARLPAISASSITTGTLPVAQLPTTGISASSITTGTLPSAQLPALSGAVVSAGGTGVTTFGTIAATTLLGNATGATAAPTAIPLGANLSIVSGALTAASGGGTPGGSSGQVQFNNAGAFGGNANLNLPTTGPARFLTGPFVNITGSGTPVANTTTQTSLFTGATFRSGQSLTIPAGSLLAGDEIEIALWGTFGVVSSGLSISIAIFVGNTAVMESPALGFAANASNGEWYVGSTPTKLWFPQVGTSGTCAGHGQALFVVTESSNTLSSAQLFNGANASLGTGTLTSINTTVALALDVRVAWNTASTLNTIQLLGGSIKKSG
jgi:hypothetical protein